VPWYDLGRVVSAVTVDRGKGGIFDFGMGINSSTEQQTYDKYTEILRMSLRYYSIACTDYRSSLLVERNSTQ
jgi:hypothetical protein